MSENNIICRKPSDIQVANKTVLPKILPTISPIIHNSSFTEILLNNRVFPLSHIDLYFSIESWYIIRTHKQKWDSKINKGLFLLFL